MSRSIKKCFAVMLALVVFVSGMSNMSLSTLADDTIQETTAISEETTDTKENKTPAKEDATPAKKMQRLQRRCNACKRRCNACKRRCNPCRGRCNSVGRKHQRCNSRIGTC